MYIIHGKSVSSGIGTGNLVFIKNGTYDVPKVHIDNVEQELKKFQNARADALNQLQSIYEKAFHKVGENDAKIFVIQQMMIHDQEFTESIRDIIRTQKVSAEYAVSLAASADIKMLESTEDDYMRARTADVRDVSQRVIRILTKCPAVRFPDEPNIVIYKYTLTPSEIIEINLKNVSAAITYSDSIHSHSAILARTMGLTGMTDISEDICKYVGRRTTVDAENGEVSIAIQAT